MKTILSVNELNKAIKEVNKVKADKTLTIIECIGINVIDGNTYIIKDNFITRVQKKIIGSYENMDGNISLDANTVKLLSKLKNSEIEINNNEIKAGTKVIKYINYGDIKEVTIGEKIESFNVSKKELLRMLEVSYCMLTDETRPILQGVYFNKNETCALDGYRMSVRKSEQYNNESEFVVNGESIDILKSLLKKNDDIVNVTVYKDYTVFNFNDTEITCKLLEENFIDYKSLKSEQTENDFEIKISNVNEVIESLDLIKEIKSSKKDGIVKLYKDSENKLTLESSNTNNSIIDTLEKSEYTNISSNTRDEKIAFNTTYLIEAIKNLDGNNINMFYNSNTNPVTIYTSDKNNFELVLPIRLGR